MSGLRLGLIGAGRWGRAYIRTVAAMGGTVSLAAVASGNPDTAKLVPPGCAVTEDWRELVSRPEVEAVIVAAPPRLHGTMTMEALEAGKPVLVEKPFTISQREAEQVMELAQRTGVAVMVEHTYLFAPAFRELVRRIPELGRLTKLRARANNEGPFRNDVPVLWDWGAHDVAMCIAIAGVPNAESARVVERRVGAANAEMVAISLSWEDGPVGDIVVGNIMEPRRRRFEAIGERGTLVFDDLAAEKLFHLGPDGRAEAIAVADGMPLAAAVAEFARAAREPFDGAELELATGVVHVLEGCERSVAATSR